MTTMKKVLAIVTAIAIAATATTPANARGWDWGGFAAGAVVGGLAATFARPYYYAPYAYTYGAPVYTYPPPYWYYAPTAPVTVYPTPYPAQPDPVIRQTQDALNRLGYGPLYVDGIAGPATWNAVAGFQANNGLAVDGIVGTATIAVIDAQMRAIAPPPPPPAREAPAPTAEVAPPVKAKG